MLLWARDKRRARNTELCVCNRPCTEPAHHTVLSNASRPTYMAPLRLLFLGNKVLGVQILVLARLIVEKKFTIYYVLCLLFKQYGFTFLLVT